MFFYVLLLDYSMFSITLPLEEPEQTADICRESLPSDHGVEVDIEPPVPRTKAISPPDSMSTYLRTTPSCTDNYEKYIPYSNRSRNSRYLA